MARFREVKNKKPQKEQTPETSLVSAPLPARIKAFITDMFMIMMPILYITTYLVLDGKDDFQMSNNAHWITMGIFGAIIILFWKIAGQTPGMRAYSLTIINADETPLTFIGAFVRYVLFIFSAMTLFLLFVPFFRKDKLMFHDILSSTRIITK